MFPPPSLGGGILFFIVEWFELINLAKVLTDGKITNNSLNEL